MLPYIAPWIQFSTGKNVIFQWKKPGFSAEVPGNEQFNLGDVTTDHKIPLAATSQSWACHDLAENRRCKQVPHYPNLSFQWIGLPGKIFTGNHRNFPMKNYIGVPVNCPLNQSIDH
jgi:hypothetical protein